MRSAYFKTLLFLLLSSTFCAFSQNPDTLSSSPKLICKIGAGFYGDIIASEFAFGQADIAAEIPVGKKFSVGGSFTPILSNQRMGFETAKVLYFRYFVRRDASPEQVYNQKTERTLSGVYIASVYSHQKEKLSPTEVRTVNLKPRIYNQLSFSSYRRYGIEIGRQLVSTSSFDFAIFAGFEESLERTGFENFRFQARNVRYPIIHSRFTPFLTLTNARKYNVKRSANGASLINGNDKVLKIGLQDLFSFSRAGSYFYPKVAFEFPLRRQPISIGIKTENFYSRNQLFDYEYFSETSSYYRSPKPYTNRQIFFSLSPQLKYFLFKKSDLMGNLTRIEGLYLITDFTARFGSTEIQRSDLDFTKSYGHSFGLGGGFQKIIAEKILIDAFLIIDKPIFATNYNQDIGVRMGLQYSLLKNL